MFFSMKHLKELFPSLLEVIINPEEIRWAVAILFSRGWKFENEGYWCLLPLADFFNHSFSQPKEEVLQQTDEGHFMITAIGHTNKNEEIFIRYGCEDNAQLLVLYGFLDMNENLDNIMLEIELDFPLSEYSTELIIHAGLLDYIDGDCFRYTWVVDSNDPSSIDDEDLFYCLRLSIITAKEYQERMNEEPDRSVPFSLRSELQMYQYLLDSVQHRLNYYGYSAEEDHRYIERSDKLSYNERNILALQIAEKTMLHRLSEHFQTKVDSLHNKS